jgi:hypothetical protein
MTLHRDGTDCHLLVQPELVLVLLLVLVQGHLL